jgi:tetratricopeptide (TPR) repeat protein
LTADTHCRTCGAEIDVITGRCPICGPGAALVQERSAPAAPAATPPPGAPPSGPPRADAAGPIEFQAEECLARGDVERALVLASRAVRESPGSLTARAVFDRARRTVLRGRRGEQLDRRVREATDLFDGGETAEAERIVSSALKLVPDHAAALALYARLKERRLQSQTAEAEAERELEQLAHTQARQALQRARAVRASGWDRDAFIIVRRGLRFAPDDPELLALFDELRTHLEEASSAQAAKRARVKVACATLARGDIDTSRELLRGLLRDDPDFAPAQAAIREVREAWLVRQAESLAPKEPPAPLPVIPAPGAPERLSRTTSSAARRPGSQPTAKPGPARWPIAAVALLVPTVLATLWLARSPSPALSPTASTTRTSQATPAPADTPDPMASFEPDLRQAVATTLRAYAHAIEAKDDNQLSAARPDLSKEARQSTLAQLEGALNIATDVRITGAVAEGETVRIDVIRTDVVVTPEGSTTKPTEEVLLFEKVSGAWALSKTR